MDKLGLSLDLQIEWDKWLGHKIELLEEEKNGIVISKIVWEMIKEDRAIKRFISFHLLKKYKKY